MIIKTVSAFLVSLLLVQPAFAQGEPQPAPPGPPIPPPVDQPYPGVIQLTADATDLPHALVSVHETIPVARPGPMVLLYPEWIPGNHSPTGPIDKLAGLTITAGGQRIAWRRDPVNVFAFHIDVPAGVTAIELGFQFLSAVSHRDGRVMITPQMLNIEWNTVLLYPAGYFSRDIQVAASLKLPDGFSPATALETDAGAAGVIAFKPTNLETLVVSPVIAGLYAKRFDLDPGGPGRVSLDVVADRPDLLNAKADQITAHQALVREAYKLFGPPHYSHYDFLLTLSDRLGDEGLEHLQSSEDSTDPKYFTDWDGQMADRDLLAHEYAHAWNGKFRRPADLWTPNFNVPMGDSLLWVYEGQTQYWGYVLATRAGLFTKQQGLDALAYVAAAYDLRRGRAWRPLQDTTNEPVMGQRSPVSWPTWQRTEDYYQEGLLIWLDVDTLIREKSGGRKSLDDFAKAFFGIDGGSGVIHTYDFNEVVAGLNAVVPNDWAGFLHQRLEGFAAEAPLDGVARGGYKLVFTDKPTDFFKKAEGEYKRTILAYSLGLTIGKGGVLSDVLWDGPAFKAGLTVGTTIVAINGDAYDPDDLKDAITAAQGTTTPIQLLVEDNGQYRTVAIDYHGGLRYPRFERVAGAPARLDAILAPRNQEHRP